jgi:transposase
MPRRTRPYHPDLRLKAVQAHQRHEGTRNEIAQRFGIGIATLNRWIHQFNQENSVEIKKAGNPTPPRLKPNHLDFIRHTINNKPDLTLAELRALLMEEFDVTVSLSTLCRTLQNLQLRRKKWHWSKKGFRALHLIS